MCIFFFTKLKMKLLILFILACNMVMTAHSWDNEELEIFDLVEEIDKNFYEFMGISKNATNNEIKRAFRGLSIQLHPDKNPSEDANIHFRNLVSIYEVLKDTSKREKYDKVLTDGLPNWKSALYYYRRMRKIGLYEGAGILFLIITVGQYMFAWAAYLEKKYTAEQVLGSKLKKLQKKNKNIDMETILSEIPSPTLKNTLPIQIPLFIWNLPSMIRTAAYKANELKEMALEKRRQELEEIRRAEELEKEYEEQTRLRKEKKENLRKRKQNTKAPEKTEEELKGYSQIQARELTEDDSIRPVTQKVSLSGSFWTDEDLAELTRLVKKYPVGFSNRWITIAETMNRTVQEVTFMAAKMKENGFRIPGQTDSVAENIVQETRALVKKDKTRKGKNIVITETNWSQEQQKALESAIVKYRKTADNDRWQKIANCVPEKTKEECLVRYKYLCDLVKSQKKREESEINSTSKDINKGEEQEPPHIDSAIVRLQTSNPVTAEDLANDLSESGGKKRNKRKERRQRHAILADEESDDEYAFE